MTETFSPPQLPTQVNAIILGYSRLFDPVITQVGKASNNLLNSRTFCFSEPQTVSVNRTFGPFGGMFRSFTL